MPCICQNANRSTLCLRRSHFILCTVYSNFCAESFAKYESNSFSCYSAPSVLVNFAFCLYICQEIRNLQFEIYAFYHNIFWHNCMELLNNWYFRKTHSKIFQWCAPVPWLWNSFLLKNSPRRTFYQTRNSCHCYLGLADPAF